MKQLVLSFFAVIFLTSTVAFAQLNIGYVDSDTIIKQLPDAQDAQKKLDDLMLEWKEELQKMKKDWKESLDNYEQRKLTMSKTKRAESEKELAKLEDLIENYRQKKFGVKGELFSKEEELMKPIHNRIFSAIQEVAVDEDLDFVFDRSGDILFLYAKEKYDITNLVLDKLR